MLRSIVLGIALLATSTACADYSPPPIDDLVLASDAIVTGRIVALGQDTFTFEVRSVVAGAAAQRIDVRRFVDWTCAARWAPYAIGQEALLFLARVLLGAALERSLPLRGRGAKDLQRR